MKTSVHFLIRFAKICDITPEEWVQHVIRFLLDEKKAPKLGLTWKAIYTCGLQKDLTSSFLQMEVRGFDRVQGTRSFITRRL